MCVWSVSVNLSQEQRRISDQTGSSRCLNRIRDESEGKNPELKVTLRILLFFKRPIRGNHSEGRCRYAQGHEESRVEENSPSRFSGGFWEEATSVRTISTHVQTPISRWGLMCLREIITHIQVGRGLRVWILTCVANPERRSKPNAPALWLRAGPWRVLSAEISMASFWEETCLCWQWRRSGVKTKKKRRDGEAHEGAQE